MNNKVNIKKEKKVLKQFANDNSITKEYLNYLQSEYNINLIYGDMDYKYTHPIPLIKKKSIRGIEMLQVNGEDTKHFFITCELPCKENQKTYLTYSSLHTKYSITLWNDDGKEKELYRFEFLHEDSVKELLKVI